LLKHAAVAGRHPNKTRQTPLRVVLDTNVVVSALLKPQGLEDQVLRLTLSGHVALFLSAEVLAEYALVLPRPKLKLKAAEIEQTLSALKRTGTIVLPRRILQAAKHDELDNRLLECAEADEADFLITGNARHFPSQWNKTRVVNAREFLEHLISSRSKESNAD
jgi:putative PIN family toxin of toxin-antitoxin system